LALANGELIEGGARFGLVVLSLLVLPLGIFMGVCGARGRFPHLSKLKIKNASFAKICFLGWLLLFDFGIFSAFQGFWPNFPKLNCAIYTIGFVLGFGGTIPMILIVTNHQAELVGLNDGKNARAAPTLLRFPLLIRLLERFAKALSVRSDFLPTIVSLSLFPAIIFCAIAYFTVLPIIETGFSQQESTANLQYGPNVSTHLVFHPGDWVSVLGREGCRISMPRASGQCDGTKYDCDTRGDPSDEPILGGEKKWDTVTTSINGHPASVASGEFQIRLPVDDRIRGKRFTFHATAETLFPIATGFNRETQNNEFIWSNPQTITIDSFVDIPSKMSIQVYSLLRSIFWLSMFLGYEGWIALALINAPDDVRHKFAIFDDSGRA